jgi:CBS domain-containing protein
MNCDEIMKRDIECVSPTDRVQEAARKMRDENVGFLPVCDTGNKPVGTITDRDITVRLVANDLAPDTAVQQIMSRDVVACKPNTNLTQALRLMRENHKSRIMCTDDAGRLVGVISLSDVAQVAESEGASTLRGVSEREART